MLRTSISRLRIVGFLEGVSFLLLLGVCVPLKHIWSIPEPTSIVGMIHGVLFVIYCGMAMECSTKYKWNFTRTFWVILAALLPAGTFVADARIFKPTANSADQ